MEFIYVCPKCGSVYGLTERKERDCSQCGIRLIGSGYMSDVWYKLEKNKRDQVIKQLCSNDSNAREPMEWEGLAEVTEKEKKPWLTSIEDNRKFPPKILIVSGVIALVIGLCLGIYALVTYSNDTSRLLGYNYRSPLSDHEQSVVFAGIIGLFGIVDGIAEIMIGVAKQSKMPPKNNTENRERVVAVQESGLDQMKKLKELYDMGIITESEYNEKREKIMNNI